MYVKAALKYIFLCRSLIFINKYDVKIKRFCFVFLPALVDLVVEDEYVRLKLSCAILRDQSC
jgi:hypothetical protein